MSIEQEYFFVPKEELNPNPIQTPHMQSDLYTNSFCMIFSIQKSVGDQQEGNSFPVPDNHVNILLIYMLPTSVLVVYTFTSLQKVI